MRILVRLQQEMRFALWDARIRFDLRCEDVVDNVRARCPGIPRLDDVDEANIGIAPSLLVRYALVLGIPIMALTHSGDPLHALMVGGISVVAFKRLDARLLPRWDAAYHRWWSKRTSSCTARVIAAADRASTRLLRGARAMGVLTLFLVAVALVSDALAGPAFAVAVLAAFVVILLAIGMLLALFVSMLAPTLLGPAPGPAYAISRDDVAALKPLLETGPIRIVRDLCDVVRALRPF